MDYDIDNEMFRLAIDLVNQSSRNIFLTGKAGTGKTTFLKYIKENSSKQMAVVAPTGVAAINAVCVTIHSFFHLPFSPFIPEAKGFSANDQEVTNKHSLVSRLRFNGEKKKVLQQLELLVIDEISMVRCDTIDAIDTVLRFIRQRPYEYFGGVQVLFIGDMYQLPPVIKDQEWKHLADHYNSQYFFDSWSIKEQPPVYIEFTKIYRQSEQRFVRLLNQVRNNSLDEEGMEILESRFRPTVRQTRQDGYIILTTHNEKARTINTEELRNIDRKLFSYRAEIKDDFSDNAHPADELLQLKTGAQVMFIKNDMDKSKRYFNGKIGVITKLEGEKIFVQCKDEPTEIEVKKEKWENIRYTMNKTTRLLEEEVLGSFSQYPLRLAWAITIHKSQGLTFEKAIIDAGDAFAPGQVYVALSRCTNLDGMILQSRVRSAGILSDPRIVEFSQSSASASRLQDELEMSRKTYRQSILLSIFDFNEIINSCKEILAYVDQHASSFNREAGVWLQELVSLINKSQATALKFRPQLLNLLSLDKSVEENGELHSRIAAASKHFSLELQQVIQYLMLSPAITDSGLHAKEYNDGIKEVFAQTALKRFLLEGFSGGFSLDVYHQRKRKFVLPGFSVNAYAGASQTRTASPHPVLHQQLRKLRDSICAKKNLPVYIVAGSKTIDEMAEFLPQTLHELEMVSGFGPAKIETYGQQFLDIIVEYCKEHSLASLIQDKIPKRQRKNDSDKPKGKKVDTKAETFKLYKEGKSLDEITEIRKLTIQTIEGHLAHYVEQGEINIEELVSREKLSIIEPVVNEFKGNSITLIKEKLGSTVSFAEIKLTIAWHKYNSGTGIAG
ncbi:MAG: family ATPase [Chitinophagaceae bacterium]|nr:family ATPase [Chitinophagaceae bacterium]